VGSREWGVGKKVNNGRREKREERKKLILGGTIEKKSLFTTKII